MDEKKIIEIQNRPFLIVRGETFMIDMYDFQEEVLKQFETILEKPKYKVSQTNTSYKLINSWSEYGLISNGRETNEGWRLFSVIDSVWIELIKEMRKLGYPLNMILKIRNQYFSDDEFSKYLLDEFKYYIAFSLVSKSKQQVFFMVFGDGWAELATYGQIAVTEENFKILPNHIRIDLNKVLNTIFDNLNLSPVLESRVSLTDDEVSLFLELRNKKYESIEIKFKDGKINMIEGVEILDPQQNLSKILSEYDFQSISIEKADGNVVRIKRKVKEKLK